MAHATQPARASPEPARDPLQAPEPQAQSALTPTELAQTLWGGEYWGQFPRPKDGRRVSRRASQRADARLPPCACGGSSYGGGSGPQEACWQAPQRTWQNQRLRGALYERDPRHWMYNLPQFRLWTRSMWQEKRERGQMPPLPPYEPVSQEQSQQQAGQVPGEGSSLGAGSSTGGALPAPQQLPVTGVPQADERTPPDQPQPQRSQEALLTDEALRATWARPFEGPWPVDHQQPQDPRPPTLQVTGPPHQEAWPHSGWEPSETEIRRHWLRNREQDKSWAARLHAGKGRKFKAEFECGYCYTRTYATEQECRRCWQARTHPSNTEVTAAYLRSTYPATNKGNGGGGKGKRGGTKALQKGAQTRNDHRPNPQAPQARGPAAATSATSPAQAAQLALQNLAQYQPQLLPVTLPVPAHQPLAGQRAPAAAVPAVTTQPQTPLAPPTWPAQLGGALVPPYPPNPLPVRASRSRSRERARSRSREGYRGARNRTEGHDNRSRHSESASSGASSRHSSPAPPSPRATRQGRQTGSQRRELDGPGTARVRGDSRDTQAAAVARAAAAVTAASQATRRRTETLRQGAPSVRSLSATSQRQAATAKGGGPRDAASEEVSVLAHAYLGELLQSPQTTLNQVREAEEVLQSARSLGTTPAVLTGLQLHVRQVQLAYVEQVLTPLQDAVNTHRTAGRAALAVLETRARETRTRQAALRRAEEEQHRAYVETLLVGMGALAAYFLAA